MSFINLLFLIIVPLLPLIVGIEKSVAPLGGPLAIISLQLFLGVTLKSIYLLFNKHLFFKYAWLSRSYDSYELAIIFIFLFSFLICIGYLISKSSKTRKNFFFTLIFTYFDRRKSLIILLISVVSFLVIIYFFLSSRGLLGRSFLEIIVGANASKIDKIEGVRNFGSSNAFIAIFFIIPRLCFFLFFSKVTQGSKEHLHKIGFGVTAFFLFLEVILRGKRDEMASVFLSLLIITSFIKGKFSFKDIRRYILFIAISAITFSLISSLRGGGSSVIDITKLNYSESLLHPIVGSTYFTDINVLASVIERMKNLEFMYGDSYLTFFTGLIPRAFWPDKPAISLGLFVKSQILQRPGTLGGVPPTMPGEAFINFGWYGLVIALVYGYLLGKLEVFLLKGKLAARGIGIYVYSIWIIPLTWSLMQSSFSITMNGIVVSLGIALPLLYFAFHKSTTSRRARNL